MPVEYQHYKTAYGDEIGAANSMIKHRAAGLASSRWDLAVSSIPRGGMHCDREHLPDQTRTRALISPSIFTRYNLNHLDFFKTRTKQEIRSIFENIGVDLPQENFDRLWKEAAKLDGNEGVRVETFRDLLALKKNTVEVSKLS